MKRYKDKYTVLISVFSGAFLCLLNQNLVSPLIPAVMRDYSLEADTVQWLTTGFTLVCAVMIPASAFLIERFSVKKLFLAAILLFAAGSFLMGTGISFPVVLTGRLLQAVGAGAMVPLAQVVLVRTFPREKRGTAMGIMALIIAFAPALGPALSGLMVDAFTWYWMFRGIGLIACLIACIAALRLPADREGKDISLDLLSLILSTLAFGGILYGSSILTVSGVGSLVPWLSYGIGIVTLVFLVRRQGQLEMPFLKFQIMQRLEYRRAVILIMIANAAMAGGTVLIPVYVQNVCGYSASVSGMLMVPGAILLGAAGPIVGRIFDKKGPRLLNITGFSLLTISTAGFCFLNPDSTILLITVLYSLRMLALGLINSPLMTWAMNALPDKEAAHGVSLFNTLRQVGGAIGTAILVMILRFVEMSGGETQMATMHGLSAAYAAAAMMSCIALVISIRRS